MEMWGLGTFTLGKQQNYVGTAEASYLDVL